MMFSLLTMMMIALTFIMQGSLIVVSSCVTKSYKGVREAAIATFSLGFSFLALALAAVPISWLVIFPTWVKSVAIF